MFQDHSRFRNTPPTPPPMNYVVMFLGEPVFTSRNWLEIHSWTLSHGFAVNAWGCLFTLCPGVTIGHPYA